jgi:hypothetical protein
LNFIESFYKNNFLQQEILKTKDYIDQQVWNVEFDKTQDIAYVFMAILKRQNKREVINKLEIEDSPDQSNELNKEFTALEIYSMYEIDFELKMQIFNVCDINLNNMSSKRLLQYVTPVLEFQLLQMNEVMSQPIS